MLYKKSIEDLASFRVSRHDIHGVFEVLHWGVFSQKAAGENRHLEINIPQHESVADGEKSRFALIH